MSQEDASTEDVIGFEELLDVATVLSAGASDRTLCSPWPSLEPSDCTERSGRRDAATDTGKE